MKTSVWEKIKSMSVRTKRIIALSVCLLLLGLAIVQNMRSGSAEASKLEGNKGDDVIQSGSDISDTPDDSDIKGVMTVEDDEEYFAERRLQRMREQSAVNEEYSAVLSDDNADVDVVKEAEYMIETLGTLQACENELEMQIKALGYKDVFALLDLDGSVDITVAADSLNEAAASSIVSIIAELTEADADDIVIRGVTESGGA